MELLLLTTDPNPELVLPSLTLLPHHVRTASFDISSLTDNSGIGLVIIDARFDLTGAKTLTRLINTTGTQYPIAAVFTEGGLVAVNPDWAIDDFLLSTASPAELETRLRLIVSRHGLAQSDSSGGKTTIGELVVDESTYTARLRGAPLDLTYKEFELLKYLVCNAGRVFTRAQLLHEVWGYDFFGGTRTVDVHVRRLRAKLGSDYESLIGTVRNVGYKAVRPNRNNGAASISVPHSKENETNSTAHEAHRDTAVQVPL